MTKKQITKATVDTAIWETNSEIELRDDYSGRGMYGDSCWGVVGDERNLNQFETNLAKAATLEVYKNHNSSDYPDPEEVLDLFAEKLGEVQAHRREDSMGMSRIYYYPKIELVD